MIKEKLFEDLINKIKDCNKLVIFGACPVGEQILKDINKYCPEAKVVGFIDNYYNGSFNNLPVWTLDEFTKIDINYDLVIMSTKTDENTIINLFDIFDIPVLKQTNFISDYYRKKSVLLNEDNYNKVINIFENKTDKDLFDLIFKTRLKIYSRDKIENYHYNERLNRHQSYHVLRSQYLENINKSAIKTVLDVGFNNGANFIAFNKFFPNLKKVYGFEAIYDIVKTDYIENFFEPQKVEIVPFALGNSLSESKFYINLKNISASFCGDFTERENPIDNPNYKETSVKVITMDKYCSDNNIKPDFIKMDIEGSELAALKGGIQTIIKYRPQLAISIYHSTEDFINIPLYLNDNLENYKFKLGHYSPKLSETVLYAIPNELI